MHPGSRPARARRLPEMRHGARADDDLRRRWPESRARRHDAALLDRGRDRCAGLCPGDGRHVRPASAAGTRHRALRRRLSTSADDGRELGRPRSARRRSCCWAGLAVLRARLGVDPHASAEHVHADRARRRRRLLFSAAATLAPQLFPAGFRDARRVETYFDTAVVITVLVLLGQVLELRARGRTSAAIRQLLDLAPRTARIIRNGQELDEPIAHVRLGDLAARPARREDSGRRRRRRGTERRRRVDAHRRADAGREGAGSRVTGATINGTGSFVMRAERVGSDTVLAQIVRMVGEAQRTRAPIQRLGRRRVGLVRAGGRSRGDRGVRGAGSSGGRSRGSRSRCSVRSPC